MTHGWQLYFHIFLKVSTLCSQVTSEVTTNTAPSVMFSFADLSFLTSYLKPTFMPIIKSHKSTPTHELVEFIKSTQAIVCS